jgi:chitinase
MSRVTARILGLSLFAGVLFAGGCGEPTEQTDPTLGQSAAAIATPPAGKVVLGYYKGANSSHLPVLSIPGGSLTHVSYVGANVGAGDACVFMDPVNDPAKVSQLNGALKTTYPALKTMFTIQGASGISGAASTAARRAAMASSCVQFMVDRGFDGIDVDWEFPADTTEGANYTLLLQAIRTKLNARSQQTGKTYLLTMAAPATSWEYPKLNLPGLAAQVDWFNLMTYDFHGPWSSTSGKTTGHNAPLYPMTANSSDTQTSDGGVTAYLKAGVAPSKIVMGVPFYAYEWYDVSNSPNNNGLNRTSTRTAPPYGGSYTFRRLLELGKITLTTTTYPFGSAAGATSGLHSYRWGGSKVPWLFPTGSDNIGNFISYDDPQSICEKAHYIKAPPSGTALRGGMIWEITMDSTDFQLLDALNYCMVH